MYFKGEWLTGETGGTIRDATPFVDPYTGQLYLDVKAESWRILDDKKSYGDEAPAEFVRIDEVLGRCWSGFVCEPPPALLKANTEYRQKKYRSIDD